MTAKQYTENEIRISSLVQARTAELTAIYNDREEIRWFQGSFKKYEEKEHFINKFPNEDDAMYRHRIKNYAPWNVVKRTIEVLTSKPFQVPAIIETDNDKIKSLEDNFDGRGNKITRVLMKMFSKGLWETQAHAFIDFPTAKVDKNGVPIYDTKARPTVTILNNDNILDVDGVDGDLKLLRFSETFTRYKNDFERETLKRIKFYKKEDDGSVYCSIFEEEYEGSGITILKRRSKISLPYIPVVSFKPLDIYDSAFFPKSNIFDPMIQQNIVLFNKDCDLSNIVSVTCFPLLVGSGFGSGNSEGDQIGIGANNIIMSNNKDAKLQYVENTGTAQQNAFKYISDVVSRLNQLGFEMMTEKSQNATAAAKLIDAAGNNATIGNFAINLQDTAQKIIKVMADWMRVDLENVQYSVDVKTDYAIKTNADEMNALVTAFQSGAMTAEQYMFELRKRGIVDENFIFEGDNENNVENVVIE